MLSDLQGRVPLRRKLHQVRFGVHERKRLRMQRLMVFVVLVALAGCGGADEPAGGGGAAAMVSDAPTDGLPICAQIRNCEVPVGWKSCTSAAGATAMMCNLPCATCTAAGAAVSGCVADALGTRIECVPGCNACAN